MCECLGYDLLSGRYIRPRYQNILCFIHIGLFIDRVCFWRELPSFGVIDRGDVCPLSDIWHSIALLRNHDLVTQDNPQTLL